MLERGSDTPIIIFSKSVGVRVQLPNLDRDGISHNGRFGKISTFIGSAVFGAVPTDVLRFFRRRHPSTGL